MGFRLLSNIVQTVSSFSGKAGTYFQPVRLWNRPPADEMSNCFSNAHDSEDISITPMKFQRYVLKVFSTLLAVCFFGSCSKSQSLEHKQFVSSLTSFHSAVSSLSSRYDAVTKLRRLAGGLQSNSPSVANMKGSDFIQQAESLTSEVDALPSAKEQARSAFAKLSIDYAALQNKGPVLGEIQQFFVNAAPSDQSWVESEWTVSNLRNESQKLLAQLSGK